MPFRSVAQAIQEHAAAQPDFSVAHWLGDDGRVCAALTYAELDRGSRVVAAELQARLAPGERAVLIYPPGLAFATAFVGCLYAGVIAVPASPPSQPRHGAQLAGLIADAGATVILTTAAMAEPLRAGLATGGLADEVRIVTTDGLPAERAAAYRPVAPDPEAVAFLQYTSGSTGTPKGVIVTQGNLSANAAAAGDRLGSRPGSVWVSWLPIFHDMGLMGGLLVPFFTGCPTYLMAPVAFLLKPQRWLRAVSDFGATISPAPNFAYDLCTKRITPAQSEGLDLSRWTVALNGAEPVRADSMVAFAERFSRHGFRPEALYPAYGLAEATVMVAGGAPLARPGVAILSAEALERHQAEAVAPCTPGARVFLACGEILDAFEVAVVSPHTLRRCEPGQIGEIWVAGPSVARGYWNKPEETEAIFAARIADSQAGPMMRTGDLGFLQDGRLYITGRLKDLIIIRGRNHYPQDIERTVEEAHPALRRGCSAAFTVADAHGESLVVVAEVDAQRLAGQSQAEVVAAARAAVAQGHELTLHDLVLIGASTLPKTTSGKIQRKQTSRAYLASTWGAVLERG